MPDLGECLTCNTPIAGGETTCRACQASAAWPPRWWRDIGVALAVTVVSYGLLHVFVPHVGMLGLAIFYGALSGAFFARDSAIATSALGAIGGSLIVTFLIIVDGWEKKAGPFAATQLGLSEPNLGLTLAALVPVALVALLPIALCGAAVGELLARNRREREQAAAKSVE